MKIKKKYRDKAMRIICDFYAVPENTGKISADYLRLHGLPERVNAVQVAEVLQAMGLIKYEPFAWGSECRIELQDAGRCYFETSSDAHRQRWADRIWGFLTGVAVTLAAELILRYIA